MRKSTAAFASAIAMLSLSVGATANADSPEPTDLKALKTAPSKAGFIKGTVALKALGPNVSAAAKLNQMTTTKLKDILANDKTAVLDQDGRLAYNEIIPAGVVPGPDVASVPLGQTFQLHSKPDANRVIYLNFKGYDMTGTQWAKESPGSSGVKKGFSKDADFETFSDEELAAVQTAWQHVREDYAPFDVDVTTQDPGAAALQRTSASDLNFGTTAFITSDQSLIDAQNCGCGGRAYINVFDLAGSAHEVYQPALVFGPGVSHNGKWVGEAISHEVGHNLGLNHDGTSVKGYYGGVDNGRWAPIMGAAYGNPISQWSKGEYPDANNKEDDLSPSDV